MLQVLYSTKNIHSQPDIYKVRKRFNFAQIEPNFLELRIEDVFMKPRESFDLFFNWS